MTINPQESKLIIVNANDKFGGYPTLRVKRGEQYSFRINPLNRWKLNRLSSSACGLPFVFWKKKKLRLPEANYLELCVCIGKDQEKIVFGIGNIRKNIEIKRDGPLYFFPNISDKDYDKISGTIVVEVLRNK